MSRQLDVKKELREVKRRDQLVRVLDFALVGALQAQGIELLGLSLKYDAFNCLLTIRSSIAGVGSVCFVGSDSIINCFLKAESDATRGALKWKADKYQNSGT